MSKRNLFNEVLDQLEDRELNLLSEIMGTKDGEILHSLFNQLESEDERYMYGYITGLIGGYMIGRKKHGRKTKEGD